MALPWSECLVGWQCLGKIDIAGYWRSGNPLPVAFKEGTVIAVSNRAQEA